VTFLGLTSASVRRDFRHVDHHVVGNGMRLDSTEEIHLDDRWVSRLSPRDLELFDSLAGDVNRRLGYA
jgi:hypothetical protein